MANAALTFVPSILLRVCSSTVAGKVQRDRPSNLAVFQKWWTVLHLGPLVFFSNDVYTAIVLPRAELTNLQLKYTITAQTAPHNSRRAHTACTMPSPFRAW